MPIGNLSSGAGQLKDVTQKLALAWEVVREAWADQKAEQFEEDVIEPLLNEVATVMPAIDQMSNTMRSAKRALEE